MSASFTPIAPRPSPRKTSGPVYWVRRNLFADWRSAVTTLFVLGLLVWALPGLWRWMVLEAVLAPDADACQAARGIGACWGVVTEKYRIILFGRYPYEEQWRPLIATSVMLLGLVLTAVLAMAVGIVAFMNGRFEWMLVVLFFVSLITFLLFFAVPGDPASVVSGLVYGTIAHSGSHAATYAITGSETPLSLRPGIGSTSMMSPTASFVLSLIRTPPGGACRAPHPPTNAGEGGGVVSRWAGGPPRAGAGRAVRRI